MKLLRPSAVCLLGSLAWGAAAQSVTVTPRISISETLTDNATLSATARRSEQTTEISPGVRISVNGPRLKTYLDYSLSHIAYAQGTSSDRNQNNLNTFGSLEAVEGQFFIDFNGSISRQTVSAFGLQSFVPSTANANQTEQSSYRLSPRWQSRLGNWAKLDARLSRSITSSDAGGSQGTTDTAVSLSNAEAFHRLGWNASASRQQVSYSSGRPTESDHAQLGLTYTVTPQFNLFANAGREANNYTDADKQRFATNTFGLNWQPSDRTSVSASRGRRSFGDSHTVSFEHRTARTTWRFSDSQDVTTPSAQNGFGVIGNLYDLFDQQLSATVSDPQARATQINQFLLTNGLSANTPVLGDFITSAVSLQRRQDISLALLGVRDTITFLYSRTHSRRLDTVSSSLDNLTSTSTLTQQGFSVNASHRLTPDVALSLQWARQLTSGDATSQSNTLNSLGLSLSGKVGHRTSASLSARRVVADSPTNPYAENALTGQLSVQF